MKMRKTLILLVCILLWAAALAETALPDGVCEPDAFTFSGGSGRVEITCPQLTLEGGAATASIVFPCSASLPFFMPDQAWTMRKV